MPIQSGTQTTSPSHIPVTRRPRKRAAKACLSCRARKVRCDVVQRSPCGNCRLDDVECIVRGRPSKYAPPALLNGKLLESHVSRLQPATNSHTPKLTAQIPTFPTQDKTNCADILLVRPLQYPLSDQSTCDGISGPLKSINESIHQDTAAEVLGRHTKKLSVVKEVSQNSPITANTETNPPRFWDNTAGPDQTTGSGNHDKPPNTNTEVDCLRYSFVKNDRNAVASSEDLTFLKSQGCFSVPARHNLVVLIQQYFLHVHPILPLIDEGAFWDAYTHNDPQRENIAQVSIFVFQAMLFAASSFVSLDQVRKMGFKSARHARAVFYRRAKLIFDFTGPYERDPLSTAQGALLLSYHGNHALDKPGTPKAQPSKANTFWLSVAIQNAKDAGASCYHTNESITEEERKIHKRLWWCCILRDRILPLGVRRPLQITWDELSACSLPLTMDDLEDKIARSNVYAYSTKRTLMELFLAVCDLALILTDALIIIYPRNMDPTTNLMNATDFCRISARIAKCKCDLLQWFAGAGLKFTTPARVEDTHNSVLLYTNLMYIYYHSARLAICRHEILMFELRSETHALEDYCLYDTKRDLEESTVAITEITSILMRFKLAKYLPISVAAMSAQPMLLHIMDTKISSTTSQTATKQGRLDIFAEAMRLYQQNYDGVDLMCDYIAKALGYLECEQIENLQGLQYITHYKDTRRQQETSTLSKSSSTIKNWGDVFMNQPSFYLRLTISLDVSIATGKFPTAADLPVSIRARITAKAKLPMYMTLDSTPSLPHDKYTENRGRSSGKGQSCHVSTDLALYNRRSSTISSTEQSSDLGSRSTFPDLFATALGFPELDVDIQHPSNTDFDQYST